MVDLTAIRATLTAFRQMLPLLRLTGAASEHAAGVRLVAADLRKAADCAPSASARDTVLDLERDCLSLAAALEE